MKTIFITGASSGIGFALSKHFIDQGYKVFASARKPEDLNTLELMGAIPIELELSDSQSIHNAIESVLAQTDHLDGLINNAAYGQTGAIEDLPINALKQQFEVNLFSWHELTQGFLPLLLSQKDARIIQISSVLGLVCMKYRGAYNASKFALEGYTDTLRLELKDTNVQVSLIEPGPIASKFRANALNYLTENIDIDESRHKENYLGQIERLAKTGNHSQFTLPATALIKPVSHALTAKKAKVRYFVTFPTYLFGTLKRILPASWLDWILAKS